MDTFLATLFCVVCVLLVLVVLLQKGRGGGLGAALGGAGSNAFGTKVGDVFTGVTVILTLLFLLLAVGVNMSYRPEKATVETPRVNPSTDSQASFPFTVTIQKHNKKDEVFYTLDGTDPTDESTAYEGAFSVDNPLPLKVIAFRAGANKSLIITRNYVKAGVKKAEPTTKPTPAATTKPKPVATTQPAVVTQ